jgi:hypothetical protein
MDDSRTLEPGRAAPGLKNASQPLESVGTAGQPEPRHLQQLAGAGYRTVLDLRGGGRGSRLRRAGEGDRAGASGSPPQLARSITVVSRRLNFTAISDTGGEAGSKGLRTTPVSFHGLPEFASSRSPCWPFSNLDPPAMVGHAVEPGGHGRG